MRQVFDHRGGRNRFRRHGFAKPPARFAQLDPAQANVSDHELLAHQQIQANAPGHKVPARTGELVPGTEVGVECVDHFGFDERDVLAGLVLRPEVAYRPASMSGRCVRQSLVRSRCHRIAQRKRLSAALPLAAAFTVQSSHAVCVVAVTCSRMRRDRALHLCQLIGREDEVSGTQGLGKLLAPPRSIADTRGPASPS
jgi:hypothetical protein